MTLVCFDWDGTIADTWPLYIRAARHYCAANDLYVPNDDELRQSFGNRDWNGVALWSGDHVSHLGHRENFYALANQFAEEGEYVLVTRMAETVNRCIEMDLHIAVVTSRPRLDLLRAFERCGWSDIFASYITSTCAKEKGMRDKPAPDMLECVMERHGETPATTVMIGDTIYDIQMANSAKCRSIAVTWGAGLEKDLSACNPTGLCRSSEELTHMIDRLVIAA